MQKNSFKVALITGAARRIGAEIATHLHATGMNVVLHYHTSRQEAEQLCYALNQKRPNSAVMFCCNLKIMSELQQLMTQTVSAWGQLDVLVNNASQFYKTSVQGLTETSWEDIMQTNVKAPLFLSQAAIPFLAKTKGSIINITDIHGERPLREYSVYCISKAGLIMLTQSLAKELGPLNIRVNGVSPGAIMWPEGENEISPDMQHKIISHTALQRHGHPLAIAKAVLYLLNDADYVTGHILVVDGGRLLSG